MAKREIRDLQQLQALPLSLKVKLTKRRIRDWVNHYGEEGVYISFSGGKDSTVLMHLVREDYPDIPAMFADVPTQFPELRQFAQTFDNVDIVRPKISFVEVCEKYGFPLISKEVAERVYYAQKYLTWWKQSQAHLTDRPTDRLPTVCNTFSIFRRRRASLAYIWRYLILMMEKDRSKSNNCLAKLKINKEDGLFTVIRSGFSLYQRHLWYQTVAVVS